MYRFRQLNESEAAANPTDEGHLGAFVASGSSPPPSGPRNGDQRGSRQ